MTDTLPCPCGTPLSYAHCCGIFHSGAELPATALDLMRSRYTAFTLQNNAYLLYTWAKATRPSELEWDAEPMQWQALEIINAQKGSPQHTTGSVEFKAYYTHQGQRGVLHERSRFIKQHLRWLYVDGDIKAFGPLNTPPTPSATTLLQR